MVPAARSKHFLAQPLLQQGAAAFAAPNVGSQCVKHNGTDVPPHHPQVGHELGQALNILYKFSLV